MANLAVCTGKMADRHGLLPFVADERMPRLRPDGRSRQPETIGAQFVSSDRTPGVERDAGCILRPLVIQRDAQCLRIVANTHVARDDCHKRGRIAQLLNSRQMYGVQGAYRFDGKEPCGVGEDRFRDTHNETAPGKTAQGEECPPVAVEH